MAKDKRKRFRLKNLKRLLCCCCPFGKKRYTLGDCDDGEDDLRGRFTPAWRVTNIDASNDVSESLCRVDPSTISQIKPDERDEGHSELLHVATVVKQETLSRETEVMTEHAPVQVDYQVIRGLCNQHCIGAILAVGFIMLYFAYYLKYCSDSYC